MIAVCVLRGAAYGDEYLQSCLDSLKGQDCTPCVEREPFHQSINAGRMAAFDACGEDLLSWVDSDDVAMPGIFARCRELMDSRPQIAGCYTFEDWMDEDGVVRGVGPRHRDPADVLKTPQAAHHLVVVRRRVYEVLRPLIAQHADGVDWMLAIGAHLLGGLVCIPRVGYRWRRHRRQTTTQRHRIYSRSLDAETVAWLKQRGGA